MTTLGPIAYDEARMAIDPDGPVGVSGSLHITSIRSPSLDDRVAVLEADVARLRRLLMDCMPTPQAAVQWHEEVNK